MGMLVGKHYPTSLALGAADHTYVECGNGAVGWGCWGGKTGGAVLVTGTGSTNRADRIAEPDERAGITCYLINGVCHQAANRILLPARVLVSRARGYWLSDALFGTYGRLGIWPCRAPFHRHAGVTGDIPACHVAGDVPVAEAAPEDAEREASYLDEVLRKYEAAAPLEEAEAVDASSAMAFHEELFTHMVQYRLGAMYEDKLERRTRQIRAEMEQVQVGLEEARAKEQLGAKEFARRFDDQTIRFQHEMANALDEQRYRALFGLAREETITLADPDIVERLGER